MWLVFLGLGPPYFLITDLLIKQNLIYSTKLARVIQCSAVFSLPLSYTSWENRRVLPCLTSYVVIGICA